MNKVFFILATILVGMFLSGCGVKKEVVSQKDARIAELENQNSRLQSQLKKEEERTAALNADLKKALADYEKEKKVVLELRDAKSVITMSDAVMFAFGSIRLTDEGKAIVDRIADVASKYGNREIMIEGHTDNVPIAEQFKYKYRSNWELSTGRACSVLHYLRDRHKVAPSRLAAVGYGEFRPVADNSKNEGRSKNRRVVIIIGPEIKAAGS